MSKTGALGTGFRIQFSLESPAQKVRRGAESGSRTRTSLRTSVFESPPYGCSGVVGAVSGCTSPTRFPSGWVNTAMRLMGVSVGFQDAGAARPDGNRVRLTPSACPCEGRNGKAEEPHRDAKCAHHDSKGSHEVILAPLHLAGAPSSWIPARSVASRWRPTRVTSSSRRRPPGL